MVQRKLISYKAMTVCQFVIYRCTEKVFSLELKLLCSKTLRVYPRFRDTDDCFPDNCFYNVNVTRPRLFKVINTINSQHFNSSVTSHDIFFLSFQTPARTAKMSTANRSPQVLVKRIPYANRTKLCHPGGSSLRSSAETSHTEVEDTFLRGRNAKSTLR